MKKIEIYRTKPNPAGKDRVAGFPRASQLLGEWVDLRNVSHQTVNFSGFALANRTFTSRCEVIKQAVIYWNGKSTLALLPGQILRLHTGKTLDYASMNNEDAQGTNLHAYAESGNFILNNKCGDALSTWWWDSGKKEWRFEDGAYYEPEPGDGVILVRQGNILAPSYYSIFS